MQGDFHDHLSHLFMLTGFGLILGLLAGYAGLKLMAVLSSRRSK